MKRLIFVVALPLILLLGGCGSSGSYPYPGGYYGGSSYPYYGGSYGYYGSGYGYYSRPYRYRTYERYGYTRPYRGYARPYGYARPAGAYAPGRRFEGSGTVMRANPGMRPSGQNMRPSAPARAPIDKFNKAY